MCPRSCLPLVALLWVLVSCAEHSLPDQPEHFPKAIMDVEGNLWSVEGAQLGEELFNDPLLSKSNKVSCATCHQPAHSFADPGKVLSILPGQEASLRHTPSLINLAWQSSFFWDGGALNLESVSLSPLIGHREMAQDLKEMVMELSAKSEYRQKFKKVFGNDSIVTAQVLKALAQYMRSIRQVNTPYDRYKAGLLTLKPLEIKGEHVFIQYCGSCHVPPMFTDFDFHNTGFDTLKEGGEFDFLSGRKRITGKEQDRGKYKTPSLRNWKYTHPYGHNGQLADLDQVLTHYRVRLAERDTAPDPLLYSKGKPGLLISDDELKALNSFLELLNETQNED
jgi:cytochrome c peroxidase